MAMAFYNRNGEKKKIVHDFRRQDEEVVRSLCRMGSRPISPRSMQEQEKRIRREIANSNERRRMQSINAGFQYLRSLLPQGEGEKLSKASILQQTADYIYHLEKEKTDLLENNCKLKRAFMNNSNSHDSDGGSSDSPFPKRKKLDTEDLSDEGVGMASPSANEYSIDEMRREIIELKYALEHERSLRIHFEEKLKQYEVKQLEPSFVPEKAYDVALQDHISYHITENSRNHKNFDRSPKSHVLNSERDSFHEVPDSVHEVPEDLSGKHNSSPLYFSSTARDAVSSTGNIVHQSLHSSPPAFTVELEVSSPRESISSAYMHSTSRQNLETIVEAIRHLEGDHMFRDDPISPKSPASQWKNSCSIEDIVEEKKIKEEQCLQQPQSPTDSTQDITLQHKIIRNAPVSQSRPGVIVSKLS